MTWPLPPIHPHHHRHREGSTNENTNAFRTDNESATSYDAVLIEDFDTWQDLAAYKADPIRDELTKYVDKRVDVRARVEYER